MDEQGTEEPATLAEATVLANQAITDLNTLITNNGTDTTGRASIAILQVVKNDINKLEDILTAFDQEVQGGTI